MSKLLARLRVELIDLNLEEGEAVVSIKLDREDQARIEPVERAGPGTPPAWTFGTVNTSPAAQAVLRRWGLA